MATIARDNVIVEFIAKVAKFRNDRRKLLAETEKEANQVASRFSRISDIAGGVLSANLISGAIEGLSSIGSQAIQLSKDYEQTQVSFEVLTGSIENATNLLRELDEFSLKTPFEPTEINNSAQTLLGFGRSVNQVKEDLEIIGEASAATGADLQNLAVVFGQVAGAGRLQGQDALQLINAGIPVYDLLSDSLNLNTGQLKELQAQGKITFDDLREAFDQARQEGGKFENALIKQSTTFAGLASTASGAGKSILRNLGDALLPLVREVLPVIIDGLFSLVATARRVSEPLGRLFIGAFRTIRAAVEPVIDSVQRFFARFETGASILERIQPVLNFFAQTITVVSRVISAAVDGLGAFFSALSGSNELSSFTEALSTIPATIGGIIRVIESVPTIVREGFGSAGQIITDFVEDVLSVLSPAGIARIVTGTDSIADILAQNEERRLREVAAGTRQQFTGFGEEIANAYATGYNEINNIEFEVPEINTPGNKAQAEDQGEDIGKDVAKGIGKGLEEQIDASSLAGLKSQLSELQKELSLIADPTSDGIDQVIDKLGEISDAEAEIARVQELIDRFNGEFEFETVDELPDRFATAADKMLEKANEAAKLIKPVELVEDPKEQAEKARDAALQVVSQAKELATQIIDIQQERRSTEISIQEQRLSSILDIADQGNAEQLQLEQDRLRKLQSEQERAVQTKQRIAAIEIAVNNAVAGSESIRAITAAFATGNIPLGIATAASLALTVGSTILTISNAFSDLPSFRVGTENFQPGRDDGAGGHPAILHRGERVLTARQNASLTSWGVTNAEIPELVGIALGRIESPTIPAPKQDSGLKIEIAKIRIANERLLKAFKNNRPAVLFDEEGLKVIGDKQARRSARKKAIRKG